MRACWPQYCPRRIPRSTRTCTAPGCWATRLRTLPLSPRGHCTGLWRIHRYLHSHRDRFSQVAHPATVGARAHHSIHVQFVRLLGDSTPRSFRQICTSRQPRCSLLRTEIDTGRRGGRRSTWCLAGWNERSESFRTPAGCRTLPRSAGSTCRCAGRFSGTRHRRKICTTSPRSLLWCTLWGCGPSSSRKGKTCRRPRFSQRWFRTSGLQPPRSNIRPGARSCSWRTQHSTCGWQLCTRRCSRKACSGTFLRPHPLELF